MINPILSSNDDFVIDSGPEGLARIYDEEVNVAVWQRHLEPEIQRYLAALMRSPTTFSFRCSGAPAELLRQVQATFPAAVFTDADSCISAAAFYADVSQILDMFSCLFDAQVMGLRVDTLDRAMCPRFHTDKVIVRLITTYSGPGTEWLPSMYADRRALGTDRACQFQAPGGITKSADNIRRMGAGDVALLKGEAWEGNEGRGVIHRSPAMENMDSKRLVLTCDLIV